MVGMTSPDSDDRWSRIASDDVQAWSDLMNHLAVVDGTDQLQYPAELAEQLQTPHTDPQQDSWAVWDGEDMVGFSYTWVPLTPDNDGLGRAFVSGGVHAEYRGRGLGRELMGRGEQRAVQLLAERHPGRASQIRAEGRLAGSSAQAMLEHRGYVPYRYYNTVIRDLTDLPPVPSLPGVRLVSPGLEHAEATRLAHNAAFKDHPGSGESIYEGWHQAWASTAKRSEYASVALSPKGEVWAYVLCGEWVPRQLYITLVGTVAQARGRGLSRACLERTIALAGASGEFDRVELDVDSQNPTGAIGVYDRVGFRLKHQTVTMALPVAARAVTAD